MGTVIIYAFPFSLIYMALSNELNWQGFLVGYLVSVVVLYLGQAYNLNLKPRRVFSQVWNLLVYLVRLSIDIFISSVEVARIVLTPNMEHALNTGLIRVPTQDPDNNDIVTAMSAHGITITPGQLVVDIERDGDETVMIVHNLDYEASIDTIQEEQTQRVRIVRRILGYE